jgi:hypothetical protein
VRARCQQQIFLIKRQPINAFADITQSQETPLNQLTSR